MIYGYIGQRKIKGLLLWEWTLKGHNTKFIGEGWEKHKLKAEKKLREAYKDLGTDEELQITVFSN